MSGSLLAAEKTGSQFIPPAKVLQPLDHSSSYGLDCSQKGPAQLACNFFTSHTFILPMVLITTQIIPSGRSTAQVSMEIGPDMLYMDSIENPLRLSARQVSWGICLRDSTSLFLAGLGQSSMWISTVRSSGSDPMIKDPPAYSILLGDTAGPHLGPQRPCLAYQLLPNGRWRFHQQISLRLLHLDSKANLQISSHHPITTILWLLCIGL